MSQSEATLSLILKAKNLASREIDRVHGSLSRVGGAAAGVGGKLANVAKVGFLGLAGAAVAAAGALAYATGQAADEQKGIAALNAALKANVKGFNGNTTAIEKLIEKREGLAFSDDDLRKSLTFLVAKYKDVTKAQNVQAVAMDVARLKGISLEEATALVSKGMDGNAKVLKQLGIELPKTATEQDRLTAIQKIAAGQAEAYGKTAAGAQEAFQIALADVVEDIGSGLLPIMTEAFTWLREQGIPAVRGIIAAIGKWLDENRPLINQIRKFAEGVLASLVDWLGKVVTWIGGVVEAITSNEDAMNVLRTVFQLIADAVQLTVDVIANVVQGIADVVAAITSNRTVMDGFKTAWKIVGDAIGGVVGFINDLIGGIKDAIAWLSRLFGMEGGKEASATLPQYASGGWAGLNGPEIALLGERGPEYVIPNHQLGSMVPSGQPAVIQVQIDGRTVAEVVDRHLYYKLALAPATTRAG